MMAITLAKIGRSIKNRENMLFLDHPRETRAEQVAGVDSPRTSAAPRGRWCRGEASGRLLELGRDLQLRPCPQETVDDDAVVGADFALHHAHLANPGSDRNRAV